MHPINDGMSFVDVDVAPNSRDPLLGPERGRLSLLRISRSMSYSKPSW